jgi:hypothetical protein
MTGSKPLVHVMQGRRVSNDISTDALERGDYQKLPNGWCVRPPWGGGAEFLSAGHGWSFGLNGLGELTVAHVIVSVGGEYDEGAPCGSRWEYVFSGWLIAGHWYCELK